MKRLLSMVRDIRDARAQHELTVSEIAFAVWVEVGALLFLREQP